jgi:signal transduction histidine kinase
MTRGQGILTCLAAGVLALSMAILLTSSHGAALPSPSVIGALLLALVCLVDGLAGTAPAACCVVLIAVLIVVGSPWSAAPSAIPATRIADGIAWLLSGLLVLLAMAHLRGRVQRTADRTATVLAPPVSGESPLPLLRALATAGIGTWRIAVPLRTSGEILTNDQFRAHLGIPAGEQVTVNAVRERIHPEDRDLLERTCARVTAETTVDCALRIGTGTGAAHTLRLVGWACVDQSGVPCRLDGISVDQTAGHSSEQAGELARSNAELEQFAYIASHDLQEPLRMIISYLQILEARYAPLFDEKARGYFAFVAGGAQRMRALINALLEYSRIGNQIVSLATIDAAVPLRDALANLDAQLISTKAQIHFAGLPLVKADPVQLTQLFQNLIANALKFRSQAPPEVRITSRDAGREWIIAITDNGIGIDPQHTDRLFRIFQRLHAGDVYPGSGIGLATCKRIVERHHGRIWVDSRLGEGAIFSFALPKPGRE